MIRNSKKTIVIVFFIIIFIDLCIGYFLIKSRSFSHLAIWKILETNRKDDFYWPPEAAPAYFRFEPNNEKLAVFRKEIYPLVKDKNSDFKITIEAAKYVMDICSEDSKPEISLKWDSPEGILKQIKEGAVANCIYRSILFSEYLASLNLKSRLWALENKRFNGISHTVTEVYIEALKKWVFIDATSGFYAIEEGIPLSFLELRQKILSNDMKRNFINYIDCKIEEERGLPFFYKKLINCVFLRARNDFAYKYNKKYSIFPDKIERGLGYLLTGDEIFVHYIDKYSKSLKKDIILAKTGFYFFIASLLFLCAFLAINLSKKDTRHK